MVQVYTQDCFPKVKMLLNHVAGNMLRETTFSTEDKQIKQMYLSTNRSMELFPPSELMEVVTQGGEKKNSFAGKNRTYNLNSYPVSN